MASRTVSQSLRRSESRAVCHTSLKIPAQKTASSAPAIQARSGRADGFSAVSGDGVSDVSLEIDLPPQAQALARYASAMFSRPAFRASLSDVELQMRSA